MNLTNLEGTDSSFLVTALTIGLVDQIQVVTGIHVASIV